MEHTSKDGESKVLERCKLPLTGTACVDLIISDLGVFECDKKGGSGLRLVEIAPGVTVDDVKAKTRAKLTVAL